jgi:hypothetical protein
MANDGDDAPVGYGRPPVGRRFEKGRSGNPRGRPRKITSLGGNVERALDEKVEINEHGRKRRITKGEAAAKQLANASAGGNLRAIKLAAEMAAKADAGAPPADPALSAAEEEIFERLVARIRLGWRPVDDD